MTQERLKELIRCVAVAKKYITDDGGDSYLSFNETDELLAHIHTLEEQNGRLRWIPVSERLPEKIGDHECSDTVIVWCAVHSLAYYDHDTGFWRDAEDCGKPWPDDITITHWMPLPDPPAALASPAPATREMEP